MMDDTELKQFTKGFEKGYLEAWKVLSGEYANDGGEESYLYVSDLIDSLDKSDNQMRLIESQKTNKQYLVVEKVTKKELNELIDDAREAIERVISDGR